MASEVPCCLLQGRLFSWVCLLLQVFLKGKVGRRGVGPASVGFIVDKQVGPLPSGTCFMLWLSFCHALLHNILFMSSSALTPVVWCCSSTSEQQFDFYIEIELRSRHSCAERP